MERVLLSSTQAVSAVLRVGINLDSEEITLLIGLVLEALTFSGNPPRYPTLPYSAVQSMNSWQLYLM